MQDLKNRDVFNLEHDQAQTVPAFILESWIVDNPQYDKAFTTFGIEVPKGTLMLTAQITDKEYYNELVGNEQIGQIFLPYLNEIADYFASADFQTAFTKMGVGVGEAVRQIDNLFRKLTGSTALTFFINLIDAAAVGLAQIAYVIGDVGNIIGKFLSGDFVGAYKAQATFLDRYNKFVKDIYDAQDKAAAAAGSISSDNRFTNLLDNLGGGGGGGGGGKSPFEKVQGFIKQSQKALASAQDQYNKTIANAQKKYAEAVLKTEQEFGQKLADIVQKSQDRLRTAFEQVVRVSLADIFEVEETKSVANLVQGLTTRLAKSQALLEKAGKLNAAGFSQTFIEQVVEAGTETGNELASAILESTPQTQAELQRLFLALESTAETGMDSLAREIYDKQGLAICR